MNEETPRFSEGTASSQGEIEARTKLYLTHPDGSPFLGIGVIWLLKNIRRYGSIRKAAAAMSLSYAKAHRMIDDAEQGLGFEMLERKRGGDSREGAQLTQEGNRFIEAYDRFQERIKAETERAFKELRPLIKELSKDK